MSIVKKDIEMSNDPRKSLFTPTLEQRVAKLKRARNYLIHIGEILQEEESKPETERSPYFSYKRGLHAINVVLEYEGLKTNPLEEKTLADVFKNHDTLVQALEVFIKKIEEKGE